jgi:hypothetical protein
VLEREAKHAQRPFEDRLVHGQVRHVARAHGGGVDLGPGVGPCGDQIHQRRFSFRSDSAPPILMPGKAELGGRFRAHLEHLLKVFGVELGNGGSVHPRGLGRPQAGGKGP